MALGESAAHVLCQVFFSLFCKFICHLYRSTFSACFYNGEMIVCGGQESSSDTIEKFDGVRWRPMGMSSTKHESAKIIVMKACLFSIRIVHVFVFAELA